MTRTDRSFSVVETDRLPRAFGYWSPVVVTEPGRQVFISGMTARDPSGEVVGLGDYEAQTRQVCENIKAAIEAAGGTLADIAALMVFVLDVSAFEAITRVRREYFPSPPPTSTMVQVPRLLDEKCLIEITATAVIPA
jgi:enamine deaminase RidA (YjgF/YER057c/UK114 family)